LIAIQPSDRKLWLFRIVTQAWYDQTSSSPRIDSSSTAWKRASENSNKSLSAIPLSDRKL
jgi:DNA-directed RNA polymerase specialized sigma24 family protein